MARFTASLIDPIELTPAITVNDGCTILTTIDSSNYTANDSTNAVTADFTSYRSFQITRPDGTTYLFSSIGALSTIGTPDETLATASSTNNEINYTILSADGDGVWAFELRTVPDFSVGTYDINENVYDDDKFWQSAINSNSSTPGANADWTEITESTIGSAYCTSEKIALTCIAIDACYERLILDASNIIDKEFCNPNFLARNEEYINAMNMSILREAIKFSVNRKNFDKVVNDINLMKTICECSGN